jgi:hypothetical protein
MQNPGSGQACQDNYANYSYCLRGTVVAEHGRDGASKES